MDVSSTRGFPPAGSGNFRESDDWPESSIMEIETASRGIGRKLGSGNLLRSFCDSSLLKDGPLRGFGHELAMTRGDV